MGLAVIDTEACYVTQGQRCDYCMVRCPLGKVAIEATEGGMPRIREDGCSGCGVCDYLCPADAIHIVPTASADSGAAR